jgi:hypothetical protein
MRARDLSVLLGKVGLALMLGPSLYWTILLRNSGYISDTEQIGAGISLTTCFVIYQIYLAYPTPTDRANVEPRRVVIENYLGGLLERYYQCLGNIAPDGDLPEVRANVMLPTKRWKGIRGTFLKMYYVAPGSIYSTTDFSLEWKQGEGSCGWAWENGRPCPYDANHEDLKIPDNSLTEIQRATVSDLGSTLSIPLWTNEKVVGVLNLDSRHHVNETHFNHAEIYTLTIRCAQDLSAHCFSHGIAA